MTNPLDRHIAILEFQLEWNLPDGECEIYPHSLWQEEVASADTWLGYWEWAYDRYTADRAWPAPGRARCAGRG